MNGAAAENQISVSAEKLTVVRRALAPMQPSISIDLEMVKLDVENAIDDCFNRTLVPKSPMNVTISFHLPLSFAKIMIFAHTSRAGVQPKITNRSYFCHSTLQKATRTKIVWEISSMELAKLIFGEKRFAQRRFADPDNSFNFDVSKGYVAGGIIEPVISEQSPLELTYFWDEQMCELCFRAEKNEARLYNGKLCFVTLRV
jgi:hypothetical protein